MININEKQLLFSFGIYIFVSHQSKVFVPFCKQIKLLPVFFLGLLSTPLPYLLIAAFYFVGFAMGVFNSNTEEETVEVLVSASIPAEVVENQSKVSTFYYQDYTQMQQLNDQFIAAEDLPIPDSPDTGPQFNTLHSSRIVDYLFTAFQFSRPPPVIG